mmetsp:Transcript_158124/g.503519  ORF Transcript_158124/g.503519 Transcript_158124/m.503519 type:complete len:107 (-) Transcript_158124:62-382(-)
MWLRPSTPGQANGKLALRCQRPVSEAPLVPCSFEITSAPRTGDCQTCAPRPTSRFRSPACALQLRDPLSACHAVCAAPSDAAALQRSSMISRSFSQNDFNLSALLS